MQSRRILMAALITVAGVAGAQPARRGGPPSASMGPRGAGASGLATQLIESRRELNLTPKQLVALDSIERADYTQRRQAMEAMRSRRDSICAKRQPCELTREERAQFFGTPTAVQERIGERLRADSVRRTRILGMLDTTQRRLAERLQSRRGSSDRMDRRVHGPSRREMRGDRMRGYGGRHREFRGRDGRRGWDDRREFRSEDRMRRRDRWRGDDNDNNDRLDDSTGSARGFDDRAGPPARRRSRSDLEVPPDTTGR